MLIMRKGERITWNGIHFYRYPDSPHRTDRVYWSPGIGNKERGVKRLHEEIWQAENGPIPDGYHVHHADHDPLNNDPSNLVLLAESAHKEHHYAERAEREGPGTFSDHAREAAAEWHRTSPEAHALHVANGHRVWENREPVDRTCERCGEPYQTRAFGHDRFCSDKCKAGARRDSGVDDIDRACERCGATFRVNRYAPTRYCGRSCARRSRTVQPNARKEHPG